MKVFAGLVHAISTARSIQVMEAIKYTHFRDDGMDRKRAIWAVLAVLAAAFLIYLFFPKPCDYDNVAWIPVHRECECMGVKVDASCRGPDGEPCPDAGEGTACLGMVLRRTCYDFSAESQSWSPKPC
jgi:hypothetical protein